MKIAFFGTPPFTIDFLDTLVDAGFTPSLVVTGPDRKVGRGMHLTAPEPKAWALEHDITVLQPEKLDDAFYTEISAHNWDLFVVVAYGKIIPERIITLPKYGTINVHYSLLPKYRGATPVEAAILNGDTVTGITIQQMTYELDSGDILTSSELPIDPLDTTHTLRVNLNTAALPLLVETIRAIESGTTTPTPQDHSKATKVGKIKKEDGLVSLGDDTATLDRKYRAYDGWPGIYFMHGNMRVKITNAHLEGGTFVIDEVIPENGKRMSFESFQNSY